MGTEYRRCLFCNKQFELTVYNKRYCSFSCQMKAYRARTLGIPYSKYGRPYPWKMCVWCGEHFEPLRSNQKFCSVSCKKKFYYERKKLLTEV
jgi:predicted nucleic acid-binding Zn ribbon protein